MNCELCGRQLIEMSDGRVMCSSCGEIRDSRGNILELWIWMNEEDQAGRWMLMGMLDVWNEIEITRQM